jgi:hypothetical protein
MGNIKIWHLKDKIKDEILLFAILNYQLKNLRLFWETDFFCPFMIW